MAAPVYAHLDDDGGDNDGGVGGGGVGIGDGSSVGGGPVPIARHGDPAASALSAMQRMQTPDKKRAHKGPGGDAGIPGTVFNLVCNQPMHTPTCMQAL